MPDITAKNICLVAINQGKLGTSTHTETCAVGGSLAQAGLMLGTAVRAATPNAIRSARPQAMAVHRLIISIQK